MIRILPEINQKEIRKIMLDIGADPCGIKIMLPKTEAYLIKVSSISNIASNILKQEMLSLGAEASIARGALTGRVKKTDCLLIGNLSQFNRLNQKLHKQPFGLKQLSNDISLALKNYQKEQFIMDLGRYKLTLGAHTKIMGIVNLTPDSFSGDGAYSSCVMRSAPALRISSVEGPCVSKIITSIEKMIKDGADIIDIGGESTRPGARPVSIKEELRRTIPIIKKIAKRSRVPISIDTYKSEVAKAALDNGAVIVNDITGLSNHKMAKIVAQYKAGIIIMHAKGMPSTMQINPQYNSLISNILQYLHSAINKALHAGIDQEKIIIDPGIGFGKTPAHNLEILKNLSCFKVLGRPILVGTSRKSFIGKILNAAEPKKRIFGTISSCILAAKSGAQIVRVHDVKAVKEALQVSEAILTN
ncbi:MAG: dihydropteroate synthase [Candidatus Omnitrophota bacterium]|nr:dihydropteroate synthase [Candidatus Omnitrophota bacterium]